MRNGLTVPGGKHYGAELPRNLSDTVQKLVQGGVPTQFLPHNTSLNSTAEAQGDSASRPGAKGNLVLAERIVTLQKIKSSCGHFLEHYPPLVEAPSLYSAD